WSSRKRIFEIEMSSNSSPSIRQTVPMVRFDGRVSGSAAMVSALDECQPVLADLQLVAVGQARVLDPLAVDVRAVEAALVGDVDAVRPLLEHGVVARDGDVVEEHVALRCAADRRPRGPDRELIAGAPAAQ